MSIAVENYKQSCAILMRMEKSVNVNDIQPAFDEISALLDEAEAPTYVVVDLRENRFIPYQPTAKSALSGPHSHPKLLGWLVISKNFFAQAIAGFLNTLSRSEKIQWFDSEEEVDTFLKQNCPT